MSIVPIRPGLEPDPPNGEVNSVAVKAIEELLEKARAGEVIGIAYALQHPKRTTSFGRAGFCTRALLGAVCLLQAWVCKDDLEE
ncbi:hypothetical protein ABIB86_000452 [Bradyrhizobium sp. JR1.7]|uniref:hypothetical protein n=1 Tax=unclassified Bradyrhizobium TaxID=2631580 RepID=UPI0033984B19